ncbi:MAG: hypothetical protein M9927_21165 [Anaerolineae bacterium]|nr:hypothetical protein [Anaerolineae bacterium]
MPLDESGQIWFSILARKLLRNGNFVSKEDLRNKVMRFIDYYNDTMAKTFKGLIRARHYLYDYSRQAVLVHGGVNAPRFWVVV